MTISRNHPSININVPEKCPFDGIGGTLHTLWELQALSSEDFRSLRPTRPHQSGLWIRSKCPRKYFLLGFVEETPFAFNDFTLCVLPLYGFARFARKMASSFWDVLRRKSNGSKIIIQPCMHATNIHPPLFIFHTSTDVSIAKKLGLPHFPFFHHSTNTSFNVTIRGLV